MGKTFFPILYTLHLESQPNPYSFDAGNYVKGHQDSFLAPLPGTSRKLPFCGSLFVAHEIAVRHRNNFCGALFCMRHRNLEFCGARKPNAPQKFDFLWRMLYMRHRKPHSVAHPVPCATEMLVSVAHLVLCATETLMHSNTSVPALVFEHTENEELLMDLGS